MEIMDVWKGSAIITTVTSQLPFILPPWIRRPFFIETFQVLKVRLIWECTFRLHLQTQE
jgi:hypothetical protein